MGRVYACRWPDAAAGAARTTAFDVFEWTPADDKPIHLHYVEIGQTTELGDTAEEQLEWSIQRGGTAMTSGSTGTGSIAAANGVQVGSSADTASGFTYDAGNTVVATFTSGVILHRGTFNIRTGLIFIPTPEMRIGCSQANGGMVVRIESTPGDSITFVATAYVEELI